MRRELFLVILLMGSGSLFTVHCFHVQKSNHNGRQPVVTTCHNIMSRQQQQQQQRDSANSPLKAIPDPSMLMATGGGGGGALVTAAAAAISPLASVLTSLTVLAGIILIHESGHYLAARSFGIAVEEFAIGFGPKLFGFTALGNDFNLRALPLGGYVRFPENYNATLVQQQEQAVMERVRERRRQRRESGNDDSNNNNKLDTTGTSTNTNSPAVEEVVDFLTLGLLKRRRRQRQLEQQLRAAEEFKKLPWWEKIGKKQDTSTAGIIDVTDEDADDEDVEIDYYDDPDLLQNRPWLERAIVLSGGIAFNILLAFGIYFGEIYGGSGLAKPVFAEGAVVSLAPDRSAAASGILRAGDVIVGINGAPLMSESRSPTAFEAQQSVTDLITKIRQTPSGESLQLSVMHGNTDAARDRAVDTVVVKPKDTAGVQTIGVLLRPNSVKSEMLKSDNILEAAGMASKYSADMIQTTASGLGQALSQVAAGNGGAGAQMEGPIGVIRTGSAIAAKQDWKTILLFAAAISINLGVVNAAPIPALDGGQLVFILAEAVSGRKLDQRVQEGLSGVAVLVLLLIFAGTTIGDIEHLFSR